MRRGAIAASACIALAGAPSALAQAPGDGDFGGVRNVLAAGQGENVDATELVAHQLGGPPPAGFTNQLPMYRDLLYAAPTLGAADLDRFFKPAGFGVRAGEAVSTRTPRAGVTIVRDRFNVPHVTGTTRPNLMFGAGYASAEDRLFLMDLLRRLGRGRLSEFAGADFLELDAEQLAVADYSEAELQTLIENGVRAAGADGETLRSDLNSYAEGINAYVAEARLDPSKLPGEYAALATLPEPWKPTDTAAAATLIAAMFGKGGGAEQRVSEVLQLARNRFRSTKRARAVFEDFRSADEPEAPVTTTRRFPSDDPGKPDKKANALIDPGTFTVPQPRESPLAALSRAPGDRLQRSVPHSVTNAAIDADRPDPPRLDKRALRRPREQSFALMVDRKRSASGHPLALMGPQIGYYSPEALIELDLHGPGVDVRGVGYPGASFFVIMGRGRDFAWSATTAYGDDTDEFAERLCNPTGLKPTLRSTDYLYKGTCRPFQRREHTLRILPNALDPGARPRTVTFTLERSVHGPVQGRATVNGAPVAIAEARSSYMHDLDSAVAFKQLNANEVSSGRSFQRVMARSNLAFNWFYADDRDIAYFQAGWYPRRARGTDPDLPAFGTGDWDWQGFDPASFTSKRLAPERHPQELNPKQGYIVNWNNKQAPGWRASDDRFSLGSIYRSEIIEKPIARAIRGKRKLDLTRLVQIAETGATVDLRGRELYPWLRRVIGDPKGDDELSQLVALLDAWHAAGDHRRDLDRDNALEHSGAVALMDAWWRPLLRQVFQPKLGSPLVAGIERVAGPGSPPPTTGSAFGSGWWGYLDKDLRALLGEPITHPLSRRYCGGGSLKRCRAYLVDTLKQAAVAARKRTGAANLARARVPATCRTGQPDPRPCDQIEFFTAGGVATSPIPWQNRPTFQQAVEIAGHRPR